MIITTEKLESTNQSIEKLVAHAQSLFADISETVKDRARLLAEAEEREHAIEKLNKKSDQAASNINDLEMRNNRLVEDVVSLETKLTEATARLDAIREHANGEMPPLRNSGPGGPSKLPPPGGTLTSILRRAGQPMKPADQPPTQRSPE